MKRLCGIWVSIMIFMLFLDICAVAEPIYATLTVPIYFEPTIPADVDLVNDALNRITREKIGAEIKLVPLLGMSRSYTDPRRAAEVRMLKEEGVSFDIIILGYIQDETILLDSLLDIYGQEIQEALGENIMQMVRSRGPLDRLPTVSDHVASAGIALRTDILKKYKLNPLDIKSLEDLDNVFKIVSSGEPQMFMVCSHKTNGSFLYRVKHTVALPNSEIDQSPDDWRVLVNYYETQSYLDKVRLFRKWYLLGYLPDYLPFRNINAAQLVRSCDLFSYFSAYKPGIAFEESQNSGTEMTVIPLMDPVITSQSLNLHNWGISTNCHNPGKAMKFLNLLYTDQEVVDLLMYGIEGEHYVRHPDGSIDYPPGKNAENNGYVNNMTWIFPNQLVSSIWKGNDANLWKETAAFNSAAQPASALGFNFDNSCVSEENAEIIRIVTRYAYGLETGQLDPDVYLPRMIEEMNAAGFNLVLAAAQEQFDKWRMEGDIK